MCRITCVAAAAATVPGGTQMSVSVQSPCSDTVAPSMSITSIMPPPVEMARSVCRSCSLATVSR